MNRLLCVVLCLMLAACEGPPGPAGAKGDTGPTGQSGVGGARLVSAYYCDADVSGPLGAYTLLHDTYIYSDSSVIAVCEVAFPGASFANTFVLHGSQEGSKTGYCEVGADMDTSNSWGYWTFNLTGDRKLSMASYSDTSSAYNRTTVGLMCVSKTFPPG
jgi:hypothetical protein